MSLGPGKVDFGGTRSQWTSAMLYLPGPRSRGNALKRCHHEGNGATKDSFRSVEEIDPHLLGRIIGKGAKPSEG